MDLAPVFMQIYWLAIYALVIYGVNELTTNSKVGTIIIAIFPFLIYPLLIDASFNGWFNIVKFFTLVFASFYATLVRLNLKKKWAFIILALLLHINIIEAILRDFNSLNYLNVASGIIVLLLLYWPSKLFVAAEKNDKPAQIVYPMNWATIIAFCTWHMCFIYGYTSGRGVQGDYVFINIIGLGIPCLVAYYRSSNFFFQSRLYTLSFVVVLVEATMRKHPEFWPLTPNLYTPLGYTVVSILALLINCACMVYLITKQPKELAGTPLGLLFK